MCNVTASSERRFISTDIKSIYSSLTRLLVPQKSAIFQTPSANLTLNDDVNQRHVKTAQITARCPPNVTK